jgi:hypothetical protein
VSWRIAPVVADGRQRQLLADDVDVVAVAMLFRTWVDILGSMSRSQFFRYFHHFSAKKGDIFVK